MATGALPAGFRAVLVALAATRFGVRDVAGARDVDFRRACGFAAVFFVARLAARVPALPDPVRRTAFAAFRAVFFRAVLRTGFRPLERATVRELFRAAFLVPPAALRLAITCSLFGDSSRPEIGAGLP